MYKQAGFTLIELLVVVLIIGVLAAIAVPQYQKAVLKSRFSSLMPSTRAVRDSNELYYMTQNRYATNVSDLDVKVASNDESTIQVKNDGDYIYTIATAPKLKNNLVMYQKHSGKFAGEIHCEADKDDAQAIWLCSQGLHGVEKDGSLTPNYKTYILEGTGTDSFGAAQAQMLCLPEETNETQTCTQINDTKKEICYTNGYEVTFFGETETLQGCKYIAQNDDGSTTESVMCEGELCAIDMIYGQDGYRVDACGDRGIDGICTYGYRQFYNDIGQQTKDIYYMCYDPACTFITEKVEVTYNPEVSTGHILNDDGKTRETSTQCDSADELTLTCTKWVTEIRQYDGAARPSRVGETQTCIYVAGADDNTADENGNCL